MLLPTTFPTAMSLCPRMLAMMEVATSGREVPAATTVRPITSSLIPNARAISDAPFTIQRPPSTSSASPTTTRTSDERVVLVPGCRLPVSSCTSAAASTSRARSARVCARL